MKKVIKVAVLISILTVFHAQSHEMSVDISFLIWFWELTAWN